MLASKRGVLSALFGLEVIGNAYGAATWPSPAFDELEDLMLLTSGYNSRGFMDAVTPCTTAKSGHLNAAGFLRAAFHDMAAADVSAGTNGLDASLGFELDTTIFTENTGPIFTNTLSYIAKFYNGRASMSDLLALGTYAAVRGCGGPSVPLRAGRIDATKAGREFSLKCCRLLRDEFS
jgi:hypothetical protein